MEVSGFPESVFPDEATLLSNHSPDEYADDFREVSFGCIDDSERQKEAERML